MKDFYKIPSVVQIFIADLLIVFCLSSLVMAILNTILPGAFGESATLSGIGNWIWFLLGIAIFVWMLFEIFRPRVKGDAYRAVNVNSSSKTSYSFCSTHPSYVLLDLLAVIPFAFLIWYAGETGFSLKNLFVMLAISLIVPCLRLFAWYIAGLRITDPEESCAAWKPVAWFSGIVFSVFALVGILGIYSEFEHRGEIANLPLIDEQSLSRETFTRLLDEKSSAKETGFVRLRAFQINNKAAICKNKDGINFASIFADLGKDRKILIVGANYSGMGFDQLITKSNGNQGKPIEVIGKIREITSASDIESWKNYCAVDKAFDEQSSGVWVLEIREP
jgi:hypothetical protein